MLFKPVAVAAFVTLALANPLPAGEADACASVHCTEGTACTVVHGQGYCAPTDLTCGSKTCLSGYECCNHSCGWCAPLGNTCSQQTCAVEPERTQPPFDGTRPWPSDGSGWEVCQKWACRVKRALFGERTVKGYEDRPFDGRRPWTDEGSGWEVCQKWACRVRRGLGLEW